MCAYGLVHRVECSGSSGRHSLLAPGLKTSEYCGGTVDRHGSVFSRSAGSGTASPLRRSGFHLRSSLDLPFSSTPPCSWDGCAVAPQLHHPFRDTTAIRCSPKGVRMRQPGTGSIGVRESRSMNGMVGPGQSLVTNCDLSCSLAAGASQRERRTRSSEGAVPPNRRRPHECRLPSCLNEVTWPHRCCSSRPFPRNDN